ncbi:TIGR02594 family protein [Agrobacterium tumefaciens]|uniref:TIGR02594 family protein n=1 Tax=Agrobacterium tumefaciens TaxID=358 RepID=A0AAE6EGU3_AGRTU|nr:TIGR02594 family protein [Agrobacterium tumefaciens]QCL81170.1 TIGR02594 family protein [Agrobacterium tumefaciens]
MTTQTFDEWLISRLRDAGAYGGRMDGVHGREVITALERFQRAENLPVTGRADTPTVNLLRGVKKSQNPASTLVTHERVTMPAEPVWMREARRYIGLKEIPGPKSNTTIMSWAKKLGGWIASWYQDDDTPWCGLFIANVIATTLPKEPLPSNPLGALNWKTFGVSGRIARGAILVFERKGGGHVGIYVGEDRTHYHVLGGNQDNAVSIARVEKSRLVSGGIRWPKTGEDAIGGAVQLSVTGAPATKSEA